eukprot:maker-scaffold360_size197209-snap-gene-0.37 protein:Tk00946 transcript:maker-scaffold360_size197209-snap-gene-0.37-mRNA-1 annotation:"sjchgc06882 protein"
MAPLAVTFDYAAMAPDQPDLAVLQERFPSLSFALLELYGTELICDVTMARPRPYVPATGDWRYKAFLVVHGPSHCGPKPCAKGVGLRTAWLPATGLSAAELLYGAPLRLPGECLAPTPDAPISSEFVKQLRVGLAEVVPLPVPHHAHEIHNRVPRALLAAEHVWVRRDGKRGPLDAKYDGPYRVLQREPKWFSIDMGGSPYHVTIDRLKLARGVSPSDVAVPPRRGRPPRAPAAPPTPPAPSPGTIGPSEPGPPLSRPSRRAKKTSRYTTSISFGAVVVDKMVFVAGQLGFEPTSGDLVPGGIVPETRQTFANMVAVLEAAGSSIRQDIFGMHLILPFHPFIRIQTPKDVVKMTVLLKTLDDFEAMNQEYREWFKGCDPLPARTTFQAGSAFCQQSKFFAGRLDKDLKLKI